MKTKSQLPYILSTNLMIIIVALLIGSVYYNLSYQAINHYVNKLVQKDIAYPNDNDNKRPALFSFFLYSMLNNIECDVDSTTSLDNKTDKEQKELNKCVVRKTKEKIKKYQNFIIVFAGILLLTIIYLIYAISNKHINKISRKSIASNVILVSVILLSLSSWKLYQYHNFRNRLYKYLDLLDKLGNLNEGDIIYKNPDFLLLFGKIMDIKSECNFVPNNNNNDVFYDPNCRKILIRDKAILISTASITTLLILISLFIMIRK